MVNWIFDTYLYFTLNSSPPNFFRLSNSDSAALKINQVKFSWNWKQINLSYKWGLTWTYFLDPRLFQLQDLLVQVRPLPPTQWLHATKLVLIISFTPLLQGLSKDVWEQNMFESVNAETLPSHVQLLRRCQAHQIVCFYGHLKVWILGRQNLNRGWVGVKRTKLFSVKTHIHKIKTPRA